MTEEQGNRPPHSPEAERSVLGAMLLDQELALEALDALRTEDFFDRKHRRIFQACRDLDSRNSVLDIVTMGEELQRQKYLEESGGIEYIASLTDDIPLFSNVQEYLNIIRNKSMLRQLLKVSRESITEVLEGTGEPGMILDDAERKIMAISESRSRGEFMEVSQLVSPAIESFEELLNNQGHVTGLPSGFDQLDKMTTGFHGGELIILAARPGEGKTSMALNIAAKAAEHQGGTIAFFSLEMSNMLLVQRMICSDARVSRSAFINKEFDPGNWSLLTSAADRLQRLNLFIDDTAGLGSMQLRARARNLKRREGLDMIFVDYLQLMRGDGSSENRQQEIARISGDLKALAKELDVPVFALSQLSRMAAHREGPPRLSDLRESGAIEQDADLVMFLYKEKTMQDEERTSGGDSYIGRRNMILKIGKQRNGPVGEIEMIFEVDFTRFIQREERGGSVVFSDGDDGSHSRRNW